MSDFGEVPKKKYGCLLFLIIFIIVLAAGLAILWFSLPTIIASAVTKGESLLFLPEEISTDLNYNVKKSLKELDDYDISKDEAIEIIEQISVKDFFNIIDDVKNNENSDTGAIVDITADYIDLPELNIQKLKENIRKNVTLIQLNDLISTIEENKRSLGFLFPALKETVLKILVKPDN